MTVEWIGTDTEPETPVPPRRSGARIAATVAAALVAGGAVGFAIGAAHHDRPRSTTMIAVSGVVVLRHDFVTTAAGNGVLVRCTSLPPLADIQTGTPVLVTDRFQRFVGATRLDAGQTVDGTCRFAFSLSVGAEGGAYQFQVGNRLGPAVAQAGLSAVTIELG